MRFFQRGGCHGFLIPTWVIWFTNDKRYKQMELQSVVGHLWLVQPPLVYRQQPLHVVKCSGLITNTPRTVAGVCFQSPDESVLIQPINLWFHTVHPTSRVSTCRWAQLCKVEVPSSLELCSYCRGDLPTHHLVIRLEFERVAILVAFVRKSTTLCPVATVYT